MKAQVVRECLSEEVTSKLSLGLRKSQSLEVFEAEEIASAKTELGTNLVSIIIC